MKFVKLDEIVEFSIGKNITRIKDEDADKYTPEDFDNDLVCRNTIVEEADCIINLISSKASPISIENRKKIITQNFLKCGLDKDKILPWYFCYQFNEGKDFERQITMFNQGTTLSVKKLNVGIIQNFRIKLPSLEKQHIIGEAYRKSIVQYELLMKKAEYFRTYALEIVRKIEED